MLINLSKDEIKIMIEILSDKSYFLRSSEEEQLREKLSGIVAACECQAQKEAN